jgi:nucleotide-binding universal stress UspA family protein
MNTILVGVDASEHSRDAIAFAGRIARASSARVVVACAFRAGVTERRGRTHVTRFALRDEAEFVAQRMSRHLYGIDAGRVHVRAHPSTASDHGLSELAASEGAALIIVGASRPDVSGAASPGGTGAHLLHAGACAVAVVPRGYVAHADRPLRQIGVGYDGTPESRAALVAAVEAVYAFGAGLTVIAVLSAPSLSGRWIPGVGPGYDELDDELSREALEELDAVVSRLPVAAGSTVLVGRPAHQLAVRSRHLDLLIVGSRGFDELHAALGGGVGGQILRDAQCPVIAVPPGIDAPLAFLTGGRPRRAQVRA